MKNGGPLDYSWQSFDTSFLLTDYFLEKHKSAGASVFTKGAIEHLTQYDWPSNVRELQNIIERAVILSAGIEIEPEDLNPDIEEMLKTETVDITKIDKAKGNISEAARLLSLARSTLFHRLKKYRLI